MFSVHYFTLSFSDIIRFKETETQHSAERQDSGLSLILRGGDRGCVRAVLHILRLTDSTENGAVSNLPLLSVLLDTQVVISGLGAFSSEILSFNTWR